MVESILEAKYPLIWYIGKWFQKSEFYLNE